MVKRAAPRCNLESKYFQRKQVVHVLQGSVRCWQTTTPQTRSHLMRRQLLSSGSLLGRRTRLKAVRRRKFYTEAANNTTIAKYRDISEVAKQKHGRTPTWHRWGKLKVWMTFLISKKPGCLNPGLIFAFMFLSCVPVYSCIIHTHSFLGSFTQHKNPGSSVRVLLTLNRIQWPLQSLPHAVSNHSRTRLYPSFFHYWGKLCSSGLFWIWYLLVVVRLSEATFKKINKSL